MKSKPYIIILLIDIAIFIFAFLAMWKIGDTLTILYYIIFPSPIYSFLLCRLLSLLREKVKMPSLLVFSNGFFVPIMLVGTVYLQEYAHSKYHYIDYEFNNGKNNFSISLQKQSDKFDIYVLSENGCQEIAYGKYTYAGNNTYKLEVADFASGYVKAPFFYKGSIFIAREITITKDSIFGFDGASYKITKK